MRVLSLVCICNSAVQVHQGARERDAALLAAAQGAHLWVALLV